MTDHRVRHDGKVLAGTLAACALAGLLLSSCTEYSALPTHPDPTADDEWQRLYPAISAQTLRAAWGLHAAAMWFVGDQGTILQYDGRQLRSYASPTLHDLTAIDGIGLDDVWAVSRGGEVIRWNGRTWSLAHALPATMLNTICAVAADDILVGGTRMAAGTWQSAIWRWDGRFWRISALQAGPVQPLQPVQRIWHPGPGLPRMAATFDRLYRMVDQVWQEAAINLNCEITVLGADREYLLYLDHWPRLRLGHIQPDGTILVHCQIGQVIELHCLALSWKPLSAIGNQILSLSNCQLDTVYTASFAINGIVAPVRPGPQGANFYIFGQDAGLTRLVWQPDHTVVAIELTPQPSSRLLDQIAGDGQRILTLDWQGRLLALEDGSWQIIPTPWPVLGLESLDDGKLVLRDRDHRLALGEGHSEWQILPDCPVGIHASWLDSSRRARVKSFNHAERVWELWGLEPTGWTLLDTLSYAYGLVDQFTGFSPDDLYALCAKNEVRWLLHHDGTRWREVFGEVLPERDITIERIAAGRHSGVLYLEGTDAELGAFSGTLHQGVFTVLGGQPCFWDELHEVSAGRAICRAASTLFELGPDGWTAMPGPAESNAPLRRHWAHSEQGLYVITDRDEIFHLDLARNRP